MEDNVFVGKVPDRLIVVLVDSRAFNGDVEWNPFVFFKIWGAPNPSDRGWQRVPVLYPGIEQEQ